MLAGLLLRTNPDLLARLKEAAQCPKMTPRDIRAQRLSWIRGQTDATDDEIFAARPELKD